MPAVDLDIPVEHRIPLVIVEGFLSAAGPALWGNFEKHANHNADVGDERPTRRVIFASVGPVSSLHDRACELYYSLRGGTVDYGISHSEENGHARYGRTHKPGLYPEWSKDKPLHFLGHSMGGPTIVKLQWLISTGFFGNSGHPDMLLSITAISAPFRGSQAVYTLGERTDRAPSVRPFSVGSILTKFVHVASYLSPMLPVILDFHADARSLSYKTSSLWMLAKHLWHSDWAEGRDATPFDITFAASDQREAQMEGLVNAGTFYRSYAACMTKRYSTDHGFHIPSAKVIFYMFPLYALARIMGTFDFSVISPTPECVKISQARVEDLEHGADGEGLGTKGEKQEALWANDGVVPLFSQWHPLECRTTCCRHTEDVFTNVSKPITVPPQPGVWHVYHVDDANHFSLVPFWFGTSRQEAFWRDMGRWLQEIDKVYEL